MDDRAGRCARSPAAKTFLGEQRLEGVETRGERGGGVPVAEGPRHCGDDALPFGGRDASVVATVAQDDRNALVPACEEKHGGSVRRREELALEEERLRALPRLGLGTLALEEEALEAPRERREQRTPESRRQDRDRGNQRGVRAGPVGSKKSATTTPSAASEAPAANARQRSP